jgi:hypothetical protein
MATFFNPELLKKIEEKSIKKKSTTKIQDQTILIS